MEKRTDLVSVIIPVYNVESYLQCCLDSVLAQTYSNIEIILLDDGSTDQSGNICRFYEKKDTRIKSITQKNQGAAAARRNALEQAHGNYVIFIDADDFIENDFLENLMQAAEDFDLVTSGYRIDQDVTHPIFDKIEKGVYRLEAELDYIIENMILCQNGSERGLTPYIWNKLYRVDLAKQVFSQINTNVFIGEDSEFLYRYVLECSSICITEICGYHYRSREGSLVHSKQEQYLTNLNELYLSLKEVFSHHRKKETLLFQLQRWTGIGIKNAMKIMDFSDFVTCFIDYIFPLYDSVIGKRIVLYGAGNVGKNYYMQLRHREDIHLVLWVDKNAVSYQKKNYPVASLDKIAEIEYDFIVIAVKDASIMKQIYRELLEAGILAERILWKPPISLIL